MAQTLNSIGFFKSYDESGNNFGLTDVSSREQALIFQIRVLGEEAAAKAYTDASPYSDVTSSNPVTAWFVPYAAYATNKVYTYGMGGRPIRLRSARHGTDAFHLISGKNFLPSDILPVLCGWVTK